MNSRWIRSTFIGVGLGALLLAPLPAMADPFIDEVKAEVQKYAGAQSDWRGPTTAPKLATGKKIAYLSSNQQNDSSRTWG